MLLAMYSVVALLATPLFLFWLLYYFTLVFILKRKYSLRLTGKPIKRPFTSILWFLIIIEPRLRAVDSLEVARSIRSRKPEYKNINYVKLLLKARLVSWLFYNLTSIPFTYVKHINLWVLLMGDGVPDNMDDFRKLTTEYFIQNFR